MTLMGIDPSGGAMVYEVGQRLIWHRHNNFDPPQEVHVVALRSRGQARLSNGWAGDSDGYAEGTPKIAGGHVTEAAP